MRYLYMGQYPEAIAGESYAVAISWPDVICGQAEG